jgi:hypothetical protein
LIDEVLITHISQRGALINSVMQTTRSTQSTPGWLDRANNVRAQAESRNHKHYKFLGMNVPPVFYDLYVNRAQRVFMLYFILNIAAFAMVFYRHQTYGPRAEPGKKMGILYAWYDEIACFCYFPGMPCPTPTLHRFLSDNPTEKLLQSCTSATSEQFRNGSSSPSSYHGPKAPPSWPKPKDQTLPEG